MARFITIVLLILSIFYVSLSNAVPTPAEYREMMAMTEVPLEVDVLGPKLWNPYHMKENVTCRIPIGSIGIIDLNTSSGPILSANFAAVDYINNNPNILPDCAIDLYYFPNSTRLYVLYAAMYFATTIKVKALIGAGASAQTKDAQTIAAIYNIPQMSSISVSGTLSNKLNYPYFARTVPSDTSMINGIIAFFEENGWKQGVIVATDDEYGIGSSALVLAASAKNISFLSVTVSQLGRDEAFYTEDVQKIKTNAYDAGYRIFIFYTSSPTHFIVGGFRTAGLVNDDTVLILTGAVADGMKNPSGRQYNNSLYNGFFGFGYGAPGTPLLDTMLEYWKTRDKIPGYYGYWPNPWYTMDIVFSYAYAFDNLTRRLSVDEITGPILLNQVINQVFEGTTGTVVLDSNGDRLGVYDFWNFDTRLNPPYRHAATYSVLTQTYQKLSTYTFHDGTTNVPRDRPFSCGSCIHGNCSEAAGGCVCFAGWQGSACDVEISSSNHRTAIIASVVAVVFVIIAAIVGIIIYRRNRRVLVRQVAEKQKSIIPRGDLVLHNRIGRGASGEVVKASFRGTDVAVKKIITSNVNKSVVEDFEMEVAIMCGLRHPNIIMLMGSCHDPSTQEMLLVMEFMSRGSLNDVLHNPHIQLPYELRVNLATQAAQGMNFLHQSTPPTIHHDLKSHNILLDDKWNARISDFGIAKLKDTQSKNESAHSIGTIFWTAPEVLDGKSATEKADCYSFGIVLWEIFHRQIPYKGRDPISVAIDVAKGVLRPPMSSEVPSDMQDIIKSCWAQNPEDRPTFQEIMTNLRNISVQSPLTNYTSNMRTDAPSGRVYLVQTSIPGAYGLWDTMPREMEQAMKLHNQTIRQNLDLYRGYETGFQDHSFSAAFSNLDDTLNFIIAVQMSLMNVNWPQALLDTNIAKEIYKDNKLIWRGLRVRMAVAAGVPNCEIDSSSGRMIYFGPVVDKVRKILQTSIAEYVLLQESVAQETVRNKLIQDISTKVVGDVASPRGKEAIHALIIDAISQRSSVSFSEPLETNSLPHMVIAMDDLEDITADGGATPGGVIPADEQVSWITSTNEFEIQESIGKGHIGDYYCGSWRKKEVAVKVLVNQKLREEDLLKLTADSSYMSKLVHPNILPFYAVCLEKENLTILSEYQPRNLKTLLADVSVQLNSARKIKIALGIAQGMSYLTSLPDAYMNTHDNLKSNNVLIGREWEVKVTDYGHSNIRELARTMTSVGNVAWTAPEILSGEPSTPKIAIYSFGIILWEIHTRQVPYKNEHPIRIVGRILSGYRPPIPQECPQPYAHLMTQCLEGDPNMRPSWDSIISSLSSMDAYAI